MALQNAAPERLAILAATAQRINDDVLPTGIAAAAEARKTRREILQHYQPTGSTMANNERTGERLIRLERIRKALAAPKLAQLTASSAAAHLSGELELSPHTLRKDIAEIRKLTGPTS